MKRIALHSKRSKSDAESPFWISYADLMSALTILLILMVSAFLLKVQKEKEGMDKQVKVKREIIQQLLSRLGKKYPVVVDPRTGAVTIDDRILFGFDQAELTTSGKSFLRQFIPDYATILLSDAGIESQIARIIIEGHADKVGDYAVNLKRSQERAYSVATYVFEGVPAFPERESFRRILSANGRSFMDQKQNDTLSRRVELKFQMKDWDLLNVGTVGRPHSKTP